LWVGRDWLKPPNLLTLSRLALAPFVVRAILDRRLRQALLLLAIAGLTDCLDGALARRFNWRTRLGAYLDPIADKALLSFGYLALGGAGLVPWWLVGIIFGRDLLILTVAGLLLLAGRRNFPPSAWGKLSTFLQIATAVTVISVGAWRPEAAGRLGFLWWTTAAATAWSGMHYAWRIRSLR
jgi:cardiolipin synthase